ncbi:MAG: M56 family metallopeptidase [Thermoanaerobaculia bacterium]
MFPTISTLSTLWFLDVFLKASLLLSLAALGLLFARRLSAAARHLIGLFGLVGALALPPLALLVPTVHVPLLPSLVPTAMDSASFEARTGESNVSVPTVPTVANAAPVPPVPPVQGVRGELLAPASSAPAQRPDVPWKGLLFAVWVAGVLTMLAQSAIGVFRVRRIVRNATPVKNPEWLALAEELSKSVGAKANVRLYHSDRVDVAMTAGVRRPVVLLPEEACFWTPERRRLVLLHEFAHIRRGDCFALLLSSLTAAIYWFHPLVWMIARQIRREGEQAADDLVLSAGARASEYASELLAIVRSLGVRSEEALPVMALAENSRGAQLEGRLRAILDPCQHRTAPSVWAGRAGLVMLLGLAATVAAVEPWSRPAKPHMAAKIAKTVDCPDEDSKACASSSTSTSRSSSSSSSSSMSSSFTRFRLMPKAVVAFASDSNLLGGNGVVLAGNRKSRSGSDWFSQGMSLYHDERYDHAIDAFKKAIELGYKEDTASYNIACSYALDGDADHAIEWLKKSADAGFDVSSYLESDDDFDSMRKDPRMQELKKEYRGRRQTRLREKAPGIVSRYEKLAARSPKDGSGYYDHGKELLRVGEYDKAAEAFQAAAERNSHVSAALYNTACAYSLKGDKKRALDALEKALEAGYDDPKHMDSDDDLDAIRDEPRFGELRDIADDLSLPNNFGDWSFGKMRFPNMFQSGQREAVRRYEAYLAKHPKSGRAHFNLGFVQLRLDHPKEAREAFQKALENGYRKPTTMYNIACSYARMDQKDAAFEWLFKALDAGFDANGTLMHDDDLDSLRRDPRFKKVREMARQHGDWDES